MHVDASMRPCDTSPGPGTDTFDAFHGARTDTESTESHHIQLVTGYSLVELFSMSFMIVVPSVSSVLSYSLPGGPVSVVFGWLVPCVFITMLGLAAAEMSSAMPTSGAFFWWTYKLAPRRIRRIVSYVAGVADCFGIVACASSITYGAANHLVSAISIGQDFTASKYVIYGIYVALTFVQFALSILPSSHMAKMQLGALFINGVLFLLTIIALVVGQHVNGKPYNSGAYAFSSTDKATDWEYGWAYLLSWMAPLWSISTFDSSFHMAEESTKPRMTVPLAAVLSIALAGAGGFVICIVIAFVMDRDLQRLINTPYASPFAQVLVDTLGNRWAIGLLSIFAAMQWWMALCCMLGGTRQTWAFAREKGLPFHALLGKLVGPGIPLYSVIFDTLVSFAIGLLILINSVAAQAIFSMAITALYIAWVLPVVCRAIWFDTCGAFCPGPFYMGHLLSRVNCCIVSVFGVFVACVLTLVPQKKHVDAQSMNYASAVTGGLIILAVAYYAAYARRYYLLPDRDIMRAPSSDQDQKEEYAQENNEPKNSPAHRRF